jgi:pimeloyl-ACP methyl ester carboxylesterase
MKESILMTWFFVLVIIISTIKAEPLFTGVAVDSSAVESGYIDVDGGRIFFEAAGHGTTIVMIHDGLLNSQTWNAQFVKFAESHRVIRWDRRGFGRSDKPNAPFSNLDDFFTLMRALKVDRAMLFGCSSGSLLAIEFALTHPDMVSSLVLVGPIVSGFGFSKHFDTRGDRGIPSSDASVDQQIEYWTTRDP